jgi:type IV secretory pathway TrbL component
MFIGSGDGRWAMTVAGSGTGAAGVETGSGDADAIATTGSGAARVAASEAGRWLAVGRTGWCESFGRFAGTPALDCSISETKRMRR